MNLVILITRVDSIILEIFARLAELILGNVKIISNQKCLGKTTDKILIATNTSFKREKKKPGYY